MRILLCLLSEQHVPNPLEVRHYAPDHLMLVETNSVCGIGDHFVAALRLGNANGEDITRLQLQNEQSPKAVLAWLKDVYDRFPRAERVANLTGGTKLDCRARFL